MNFIPIINFQQLKVGLVIKATDQWDYDKDIDNSLWSEHMKLGVKIRSLDDDDRDESFYIDTLDGTTTENGSTGWSIKYTFINKNCVIEGPITKSIPRFQLIDDEI